MQALYVFQSSLCKLDVIDGCPGIKEPVGGGAEAGIRLGLGKQEQDKFYTAADNIQRKRLETELQANEDDSRAAMREVGLFLLKTSCLALQKAQIEFSPISPNTRQMSARLGKPAVHSLMKAPSNQVETERGQKIKEDVTLIKRTFFCEVD